MSFGRSRRQRRSSGIAFAASAAPAPPSASSSCALALAPRPAPARASHDKDRPNDIRDRREIDRRSRCRPTALTRAIQKYADAAQDELLAGLTPAERQQLSALLAKLLDTHGPQSA